ncbi:MAG TPA: hypothetical protein VK447_17035 [Myxococcaceae bacterium]|nr:hypothetical protein [Myxococcaceae bacterium]
MASYKVGGEVDAFCTRCKMTLAHTILAMVGTKIARVRCNTCGGDHAYRSAPGTTTRTPASPKSSKRTTAEERAEKQVLNFQEQLAGRDLAAAPMYSPKDSYQADQLINHPTFGYGIVTTVRNDKVDISFKGQQKTLVHKRGETPGAKPSFSPPKTAARAPADKPVSGDAAAAGDETAPDDTGGGEPAQE